MKLNWFDKVMIFCHRISRGYLAGVGIGLDRRLALKTAYKVARSTPLA